MDIHSRESTSFTDLPEAGFRLGDLVLGFEMVSESEFEDSLSIAKETGLPIGNVLVMSNLLSESDLRNVLRCQSLLREHAIAFDIAREALERVKEQKITLDRALVELGWDGLRHESMPLGKLLVDAEFISRDQLEKALRRHKDTTMPVGRILVLEGSLPESLLSVAINAQNFLREGKITQTQALEALKEARRRHFINTPPMQKSFYLFPTRNRPRLGELLLLSGLITQSDLNLALETSFTCKKPLGETLVEMKLITNKILDSALRAQNLIADSTLRLKEGKALITSVSKGMSISDALEKVISDRQTRKPEPQLSLSDFMKAINVVKQSEIDQAFAVVQHNSDVIMKVLLIAGVFDEQTLAMAEQCRALVIGKRLSIQQARTAFDYARKRNIKVQEALRELHWQDDVSTQQVLKTLDRAPENTSQWIELQTVADQLIRNGQAKAAREIWQRMADNMELKDSKRYFDCLDAIAETFLAEQEFEAAEDAYRNSLDYKLKHYGRDSLPVSWAYNNLSRVLYFQGEYDEAVDCLDEHIRICGLIQGTKHPDVACAWQNLATIFHVQQKFEHAEKAYRIAHEICEYCLGAEHASTNQLRQMVELAGQAAASARVGGKELTGSWKSAHIPGVEELQE
jgi:tetratricopeptide (TPR) repeat protein